MSTVGCSPFPGAVQLQPWHADGEANAFFHNRGRLIPPANLIPDAKPHPFQFGGLAYHYAAGSDDDGPFIATFLDPAPQMPFFVGLLYRPTRAGAYIVRCADCVRRWQDEIPRPPI